MIEQLGADTREAERLDALASLRVLDTAPEPELDALVQAAAELFDAPIALVSLVDERRAWFKARVGLELTQVPRASSFCTRALDAASTLVVADAGADARFAANPLVTGPAHVRFYAGAPLITPHGARLGTICVLDRTPRAAPASAALVQLEAMAAIAAAYLEGSEMRRRGRLALAMERCSADALVCADTQGRITDWSPGAERVFGYSAREAVGQPLAILVPERLRDAHRADLARVFATGAPSLAGRTLELPALRRDGVELTVEFTLSVGARIEDGLGLTMRDITAKKAMEAEKARDGALLATLFENIPAFIFVKDAATLEYRLVNRAGERVAGLDRAQILGRTDRELMSAEYGAAVEARDRAALASPDALVTETKMRNMDVDQPCWLRTRRVVVPDASGAPMLLIGISEDVTELRDAEARSKFLSGHDELTGLSNRTGLIAATAEALARGARPAVLSIDLDRFKAVNDFFGHAVGDMLLKAVAAELEAIADTGDTVARLGGDEFAILHLGDRPASADALARRVVVALGRPFLFDAAVANVAASVGVAVAPSDGDSAEELMRNADLALARVRAGPRVGVGYFEPGMDKAARERRELEAELRSAMASGHIRPYFQPIANVVTGEIESFEALARWPHATRGMVPPDQFIAVAEESGLIIELGRCMLRAVLREAAGWARPLRVAVNVSPAQLAHPGFVAELTAALADTGVDGSRLVLEVTENLMIQDVAQALAVLTAIKSLGVQIALDDFGTGYSSLGQMRQFPFDVIKVDRSFVADMIGTKQAMAIVQAAIGLGRGMDMPVVAEGVETQEQLDRLRQHGCTHAQGWLIGRPQPADCYAALTGAARARAA